VNPADWTQCGGSSPAVESYSYNATGNLMSQTGVGTYQYWDAAHRHAVTNLNNGPQMGWYDNNGNMTQRIENGVTYVQGWDADNKLTSVTASGQSSQFAYDADGNRVRKIETGAVCRRFQQHRYHCLGVSDAVSHRGAGRGQKRAEDDQRQQLARAESIHVYARQRQADEH